MGGRSIAVALAVAVVGSVAVGPVARSETPLPPGLPANEFVLSPEGNRLWAYDAGTGERQLLVPSAVDSAGGRDVNGQVCMDPDGSHFVAGEDTAPAGQSHNEAFAGWGYFSISGTELGSLTAAQVGKMAPGLGAFAGDPDNYGCGFLDGDRLLTTAIGDTFPHQPANGQLFLWFGPFDSTNVARCEVDRTLATAGGIAVDPATGDVYVAANRPDGAGNPGGIWRYSGTWPTSPAECETALAAIDKDLIVPAVPAPDPRALTPSSVVIGPNGNLFVSSVFTGTVSEYTKEGEWVRDVYPSSPVAPRTGPTGDTPFGLAFTADGSLWISDLGIVTAQPAPGEGSVIRVAFDGDGNPSRTSTIAAGLDFPDGLGVYTPSATPNATSQWPCGNWGMYGRTLTRTFSSDCPTPISPETVAGLRPDWVFRPPTRTSESSTLDQTTFTASPTVVDGVVYIGGWDGFVYAIDAETGTLRWESRTETASGATFGPIVSSAAVADVAGRRLVIVGSGPRVYAFDARNGAEVWTRYVGGLEDTPGEADDPAEVESSPVVWNGTVYVGMDVHNQPGSRTGGVRGGMLALDAATGALKWKYEPEAVTGEPASGCGGVWGSPVIDPGSGFLYFGTANCPAVNDNPKLPMESIYALTNITGDSPELVWKFTPHKAPDLDEDFGATPNLMVLADGTKVLAAGSKDGGVYFLDPATGLEPTYTNVVEPAPGVGGFIGATASWRGRVFGATAISQSPLGYHAFDAATGEVLWQHAGAPSYAPSAVTNGVVFAGALDGVLKAYDADTGQVLWASPLAGPVSSGAVVVGDMVFIGAGTSSSDLCAKGRPDSAVCFAAFDTLLGQQGGVHAFRLGN